MNDSFALLAWIDGWNMTHTWYEHLLLTAITKRGSKCSKRKTYIRSVICKPHRPGGYCISIMLETYESVRTFSIRVCVV